MSSDPSFVVTACQTHQLADGQVFHTGSMPEDLELDAAQFEDLWELHPAQFHEITMFGRPVKTPRWQQAYGKDYRFSGQVNRALPIPDLIHPYLRWARNYIHSELNGALLNWYDGRREHYIGPHKDDTRDLLLHSPIVTMSFGEQRTFRFTNGTSRVDVIAKPGSLIVIPWNTNLHWKHSVPHLQKYRSRRVSITLRAFE